jgi:hypothetical protein
MRCFLTRKFFLGVDHSRSLMRVRYNFRSPCFTKCIKEDGIKPRDNQLNLIQRYSLHSNSFFLRVGDIVFEELFTQNREDGMVLNKGNENRGFVSSHKLRYGHHCLFDRIVVLGRFLPRTCSAVRKELKDLNSVFIGRFEPLFS